MNHKTVEHIFSHLCMKVLSYHHSPHQLMKQNSIPDLHHVATFHNLKSDNMLLHIQWRSVVAWYWGLFFQAPSRSIGLGGICPIHICWSHTVLSVEIPSIQMVDEDHTNLLYSIPQNLALQGLPICKYGSPPDTTAYVSFTTEIFADLPSDTFASKVTT